MVHGVFTGLTDYSNQSLKQILDDVECLQQNSSELIKYHKGRISKLKQIYRDIGHDDKMYSFMGTLGIFNTYLVNVFIPDNCELIEAIHNSNITQNIIKKVEVIGNKGWDYHKKFHQCYPDSYSIVDEEILSFLEELIDDTDDIVSSLMDYINIADRLKDFELEETDNGRKSVYELVVNCCKTLLNNQKILENRTENDFNTYLASLLEQNQEIVVKDQTLKGKSSKGKTMGEVDIWIESESEVSILEAMKLNKWNKTYVMEHIERIFKYDTHGNRQNFLVTYYVGSDFEKFCSNYKKILEIPIIHNSQVSNIEVYEESKIKHILLNFTLI